MVFMPENALPAYLEQYIVATILPPNVQMWEWLGSIPKVITFGENAANVCRDMRMYYQNPQYNHLEEQGPHLFDKH